MMNKKELQQKLIEAKRQIECTEASIKAVMTLLGETPVVEYDYIQSKNAFVQGLLKTREKLKTEIMNYIEQINAIDGKGWDEYPLENKTNSDPLFEFLNQPILNHEF